MTQKIKAINPDIPVILATGFNSKIDKETAMELGVQQYVEKSFDRAELALAIKAALYGHKDGLANAPLGNQNF